MKNLNLKQLLSLKGLYFLITLIIALLVGIMGGIVDIIQPQGVVDIANHLGYPLYFFTLLGVFKVLGGIAILLPKSFDKAKNIAYYGFGFDFIFASYSHYSVNDPFSNIIVPLVLLVLLATSYFLKEKFSY